MQESAQMNPSGRALILPLASAVAIAWLVVSFAQIGRELLTLITYDWVCVLVSPFVLFAGALLLRSRPRLGYIIAAFGAVLPFPWFSITETRTFGNSWTALNAAWRDPYGSHYLHYYQLRIITVALLMMTLISGMTRLLPPSWRLRNRPVNQRTWPAVALSLIFVGFWFAAFVSPYREPMIVDALQPELTILNVRKDGITFHECRVSVYRNRYYVAKNDRRLFRYSFPETVHEGLLTDDLRSQLKAVQALPELKKTQLISPAALRARHGEGWYTEMGTYAITAFTTENAANPPRDLVAFFNELEAAPPTGTDASYVLRDVCLGFCYDPKAGLGYRAENQRCGRGPDGKDFCY